MRGLVMTHHKLPSLAVYRYRLVPRNVSRLRFSTQAADPQGPRSHKGRRTVFLVAAGILVVSTPYLVLRDLRICDSEKVSLRSTAWPKLGISQISTGSCDSNKPGEDAISMLHFNHRKLGYFGIYDGHNGGDLSKALSDSLLPMVSNAVNKLYRANLAQRLASKAGDQENIPIPRRPSSEAIDNAIKQVFIDLDYGIVHLAAQKALGLDEESYKKLNEGLQEGIPSSDALSRKMSLHEVVKTLKLANAGSCVMVGIFDGEDRSLRIALTGDLRAVFGRRVLQDDSSATESSGGNPESKRYVYEAEALTDDQNATNPSEAARLSAEHPNEEDLLKNGRVLGWGPARSFGDGTMKWSRAVRERLKQECLGDMPRENYRTPPYFTAEPVITTKEGIQKGDFVVLATDGLWECFENEEVVGLVGQWLETHGTIATLQVPGSIEVKEVMVPPSSSNSNSSKNQPEGKIYTPSDLPVIYPPNFKDNSPRYRYWRAEKKFVCEDKDSVAHHLIRNALGGANKDLHNALLEYKPPRSRRFRDDISVIVVFFD